MMIGGNPMTQEPPIVCIDKHTSGMLKIICLDPKTILSDALNHIFVNV